MDNEINVIPEVPVMEDEGAEVVPDSIPDTEVAETGMAEAIPEKRCAKCQAILEEGVNFCPECGSAIVEENVVSDIYQYNQSVIAQQAKKKKGKKATIIISIVLVAALAIGIYLGCQYQKRQQVLAYSEKVEEYVNAVNGTKLNIMIVSNAWEIVDSGGYYLYYGSIKLYARNLYSSYISGAKTAHTTINNLYDELQEFELEDPYVSRLKNQIRSVQDAYENLYNEVIVREVGYNSSEFSALNNGITTLGSIIEEVKADYGNGKTE